MKHMNLFVPTVILGILASSVLPVYAEPQQTPSPATTTSHSWTTEQVVTSSVREAWALGGKTPEGFFEIVKVLAEISAQKRGLSIPENEGAGAKAGEWIKKQAKKDPDQLLYVIVDQAVQHSANVRAQN